MSELSLCNKSTFIGNLFCVCFSLLLRYRLPRQQHTHDVTWLECKWMAWIANEVINFIVQHSTTFPSPCLSDGVKHSSKIFSFVLCLTNFLLCDPNTSTWIHLYIQLFPHYPLSTVCDVLLILTFTIYWPVMDMAFSLKLCLEEQNARVAFSLLKTGA